MVRLIRNSTVLALLLAFAAVVAALAPQSARGASESVKSVGAYEDEEFPNLMVHSPSVMVRQDNVPAGLPADVGAWAPPLSWPDDAVHMLPLYTGQVLFYRGDQPPATTYTWNPATNEILPHAVDQFVFCGGHSFLPDGRVLSTGGALAAGLTTGPAWTFIFDPETMQWNRVGDMLRGRYYPTNIVLGDGRTLVLSGTDETGATNDLVEAYVVGGGPGGTDLWQNLVGASKAMSYYPRMHLTIQGNVVAVGPDSTTRQLDPTTQTWTNLAGNIYGSRTHGTSLMLPPDHTRIMILGGHNRSLPDPLATSTTEILDLTHSDHAWVNGPPMHHRRMHANTAILPDGKVLVAGGTSDEDITPVYPAEILDPATMIWTEVAPLTTKRGYHSSMVLLPDGRVVMGGSNGNHTAEVYSPPYLFNGPRPVIDTAPNLVQYGEQFTVTTAGASGITSVVFMRPGSSTHSLNMEQRYVPLNFSASSATTLSVVSPDEPNIAPPGYYMMFILNGSGVPSVAQWVKLGGAIVGNRRPSVDAGATHTLLLPNTAPLDGTVSDDGLPASPGAVTTSWSVVSGPGPVSFADPSAMDTTASFTVSGTYLLRLTADDGDLVNYDGVNVHVSDTAAPGIPVEIRVAAGSDDAEESLADSTVSVDGGGDLEMAFDTPFSQIVGMRFLNLPLAQGTPILNAWIQFRADETDITPAQLRFQGHDVDDAPTFVVQPGNLSARARTSAVVWWSPQPWAILNEIGPAQRSPNLKSIIQEIVDRPGWTPGNAIAILVTGSGERVADSYEGWPPIAPLLHLDLGVEEMVNQEPTVQAGPDRTIRLNEAAILNGAVEDDGLPSPPGSVTLLWVKESGPGQVTFADPEAIDTTATFSTVGRYELQLLANDGETVVNDSMAVVVENALPVVAALERKVSTMKDDVEEKANGSIVLNSTDLEMAQETTNQKVGLRFTNVTIPKGATIVNAYVQFMADEPRTGATSLLIQGQAAYNAPAFSTTRYNVSARARTTASTSWNPEPWGFAGERGPSQRTPNIAAVIQEIVNQPGWSGGQALVLIITGTGVRTATAIEGSAANAPLLHIDWN